MDANLLAILVCPNCKGALEYRAQSRVLVCKAERLAFPITDEGVPVMLLSEAKPLGRDKKDKADKPATKAAAGVTKSTKAPASKKAGAKSTKAEEGGDE